MELEIKDAEEIEKALYDLIPESQKECDVNISEARCDKWTKEYNKFHERDRMKWVSVESLIKVINELSDREDTSNGDDIADLFNMIRMS